MESDCNAAGYPSMAKQQKTSYTDILIRQQVLSAEQVREAEQMAQQAGMRLQDSLIRLGYATGEEVMRAMAEQYGMEYVDLDEVVIPPSVVELVPESLARENVILPLSEEDGMLKVIASDPDDYDTMEKLRFILNRRIETAWPPARAFWRRSTATTGRRWARARTRCSRSSPIRRSTSPRRTRRPAAARR